MTQKSPLILHIAIAKPVRHCFDYFLPPNEAAQSVKPGIRVLVPFGKKQVVGILLKADHQSCIPLDKVKPALELLDTEPLIPEPLFTLYQWASRYYQHPIGEVILGTLPTLLRRKRKKESVADFAAQEQKANIAEQSPHLLNPAQIKAIEQLQANVGFTTYLLQGVTGSGKTEVYLQAIAHCLRQGKQALVLVPEIGLTPQTIARFEQRFPQSTLALHSKLSDRERLHAWLKARNGLVSIIIGTRSALFTPLPNLGMIILDEEHDHSFKQQNSFRYSARDLAILRGQLQAVPVVLGTATPSLETLNNARNGRFQHLLLPERAGNALQPNFHIIDLRNQYLEEGLSPALLAAMRRHLAQNNQVLLFLNRRGFAPTLLCHSCGWSAQCQSCDAALTLHQKPSRLLCHHCTRSYPIITLCPQCRDQQLVALGYGTERLEQALQQIFPETPVIRMDRDSIRQKGAMEKILAEVQQGQRQILLGTQMLAKGHHFPEVTMVGIINADGGLYSSDFRASEQMGQLITQVAGRAGRAEKPGEVYIQTHNPDHPLLQALIQQGYGYFAENLLENRRLANWPPFSALALLRAEAINETAPLNFLNNARTLAEKSTGTAIQICGPIPAPMLRKAGHFRALLLFQASQRSVLQRWLEVYMGELTQLKISRQVRWSLDVDPIEVF